MTENWNFKIPCRFTFTQN